MEVLHKRGLFQVGELNGNCKIKASDLMKGPDLHILIVRMVLIVIVVTLMILIRHTIASLDRFR